ncbi:MAG: hypothetical protein LC791_08760 [Acidobacteria bacterium]|nr:hypothetical protein [Acidobacteriota bacterium]
MTSTTFHLSLSPLLLVAALLQAPVDGCSAEATSALSRARARRDRVGTAEAAAALAAGAPAMSSCVPLRVASWALAGWREARAAAARGGAPEVLGPARAALDALVEMTSRSSWRVQNDYARAAIVAAIAAAQDERDDLGAYLSHARGLAARLGLAGERAEWPLPIHELEGELWLEVDRYSDAREAYQHAIGDGGGASALVGLARVSARLHDEGGACAAYSRASVHAEGALAAEARAYLERPACQR